MISVLLMDLLKDPNQMILYVMASVTEYVFISKPL